MPTPSGNQPFISQDAVRAALDALLYTSAKKPANPLLSLLLIDQFLADPAIPPTEQGRSFALRHILTSAIAEQYATLRRILNLRPMEADQSLDEILSGIADAAQTGSPELLGWAWLYVRYVRVELNFSPQLFCQAAHIDERSLRRYQQHAIKRLTDELIQSEWDVRRDRRQRRLYASIPVPAARPFVGRGDDMDRIHRLLENEQPVYLTGSAGVGKSTLSGAIVRALIAADRVDQVVWIQSPSSRQFVLDYLSEYLLRDAQRFGLREYLLVYRTLIVLDEIDALLADADGLRRLIDDLSAARLILTSRLFVPIINVAHISLAELSPDSCEKLARELLEASAEPAALDEVLICREIGGNPLALRLTLSTWRLDDVRKAAQQSIEQLYALSYEQLGDAARALWFAFALFPLGSIALETIQQVWALPSASDNLSLLLRQHLVERAESPELACVLPTSARRFIENRCRSDSTASRIVANLIDALDQRFPNLPSSAFELIEQVLMSEWIVLESDRCQRWISAAWPEGIRCGRWSKWRYLLSRYLQQVAAPEPAAAIAYGVCLRRLGEWNEARQVFDAAVAQFGREGLFADQVGALLELGVLLRYQGEYEKSVAAIARAGRIAVRYRQNELAMMCRLEEAQVAVDRADVGTAHKLLAALPKTVRVLTLWSETYLLAGDFERCQALAEQALALQTDAATEARIRTLLGRCCEFQRQFEAAHSHFSYALTLLEQSDDALALARAQANLGALLLQADSFEEARVLLYRAEYAQSRLNDPVGLAATRHNLHLLVARLGS